MPYEKISELPPPVKDNLPAEAQRLFMGAYNGAFADYDEKTDGPSQEAYANAVAWASVKRAYHKNDAGDWVAKKKEFTMHGPQARLGDTLQGKIHEAFTVFCDQLLQRGFLTRDERISLSNAIGDALGVLEQSIDPALAARFLEPAIYSAADWGIKPGEKADDAAPVPAGGKGCEDSEEEEDAKAGRRLQGERVGLLTEVKAGLEGLLSKLASLLGWAQYEDEEAAEEAEPPAHAFDTLNGWTTTKAADGRDVLLVWSTNAFKDREEEIFATKALADYVAAADRSGDRGTIDFWHIPGTDFATVKEQAMIDRFMLEVAEFDDTGVGRAFKAFLSEHPRGHPEIAPRGWGASPQYRYDPTDRADGVYERMRKEKTSVLPAHKAANGWNPQPEVWTGMDEEKKKALEAILGAEKTAELIAQGESLTKELEAQGVAFKAESPAPQETPPEPEAAPVEEKKEAAVEAAPAASAPDLVAQLTPLMSAITDSLKSIGERLTVLETKAAAADAKPAEPVEEKAAEPTPFDTFAALIRASVIGNADARLDKRTKEGRDLTAGPQQTQSAADGPTPVPFINAMIAGQDFKSALGVPLGES